MYAPTEEPPGIRSRRWSRPWVKPSWQSTWLPSRKTWLKGGASMTPRLDILEEQDSLRAPFLESVIFHAAVFGLLALGGISYQHSREIWGGPKTQAGDAVQVNAVKNIPLPSRTGQVNPVANDT